MQRRKPLLACFRAALDQLGKANGGMKIKHGAM